MKNPKKKIEKKVVKKSKKPSKKKDDISAKDVSVLEDAFDGDKEMVLFFLAYLKYDRNASKAYKFLHPDCTDQSCRVMGSRQLTKVNISMILDSYGLGIETYIKKINDGLNATNVQYVHLRLKKEKGKKEKIIYDKIETPNHQVQKSYHESLGKLLGIEGKKEDGPTVSVQVNNLINKKKNEYGI